MANPTERAILPGAIMLPLKEVAIAIAKHKNLHEGCYNLAFHFQIAAGGVGPNPTALLPGVMAGVSSIGLERVEKSGPHTIDAAIENPAPRNKTARAKLVVATKPAAKPLAKPTARPASKKPAKVSE